MFRAARRPGLAHGGCERLLAGARRKLQLLATMTAVVLGAAAVAPAAMAADYPTRPIKLIIGFPPGAAADISARLLADHMSKTLGQQVVVEARPGAASTIAAEYVARAPKDGHTLFLASAANAINGAMGRNKTFDLQKDFAPITLVTAVPVILAAHPSIKVKDVKGLIALAKSKPGEVLYASTGVGTVPHLAGELFKIRTGADIRHIPYQGSPKAMTDLLAGRVGVMFSPSSTVMPHIQAGKLTGVASTTAKRAAIAPDLPTMQELGIPNFETSIWFGLVAPAGTPQEVVDKLAKAANAALKSDDVASKIRTQGYEALGGSPQEFADYLANDVKKWSSVAKSAGLAK